MKYILRPYRSDRKGSHRTRGLGCGDGPVAAGAAQSTANHPSSGRNRSPPVAQLPGLPGRAGVGCGHRFGTKLKLKEVRGALITLIDHDAPAGQAGLRVNDVVMEINGQKRGRRRAVWPHAARDPGRPQSHPADQPRWQSADHRSAALRSQSDGAGRLEQAVATGAMAPPLPRPWELLPATAMHRCPGSICLSLAAP